MKDILITKEKLIALVYIAVMGGLVGVAVACDLISNQKNKIKESYDKGYNDAMKESIMYDPDGCEDAIAFWKKIKDRKLSLYVKQFRAKEKKES